ncbi:MAG: hypothetical protein JXR72_01300 [Proteobacteria bacterium]|nr:hypothetical protein [Pseudomonadota bacterium]
MDIKKLLILLIFGYLLVSGWRIGTPYIKNAMFQNDIDNIARSLSIDGTVERARRQLLEAVAGNGIPASEKDFTVMRDENTRQVFVGVKYSVSVSTPFDLYTYTWNFNPQVHYGLQKIPKPAQ